MVTNSLIMVIDGRAVCASFLKDVRPEHVHLIKCPFCSKKGVYTPICDLIQNGMFEDDIRTVFECQECHTQVYVRYQVPVYSVVTEGTGDNADN